MILEKVTKINEKWYQNELKMGVEIDQKSKNEWKNGCQKWRWNLMKKKCIQKLIKSLKDKILGRPWVDLSCLRQYTRTGPREVRTRKSRIPSDRLRVPRGIGCCERKSYEFKEDCKQQKKRAKMKPKVSKSEERNVKTMPKPWKYH